MILPPAESIPHHNKIPSLWVGDFSCPHILVSKLRRPTALLYGIVLTSRVNPGRRNLGEWIGNLLPHFHFLRCYR